jgi:hypothetical protein
MKRSSALIVVLIVALAFVPMAFAAGKGKGHGKGHGAVHGKAKGKNKFQLNGVVFSADTTGGSLVVTVKSGSKTVKAFRGLQLPVLIAPNARFVDATSADDGTADDATAPSPAPLTLADLVTGARVHLGGTIDRTDQTNPVFTATKIILQALPFATPTPTPTDVTPTPDPSPSDTPVAMLIR